MPIFHPYTYDKGIGNSQIETSIIPWDETEDGYNDYKESFACGTLKEVRYRLTHAFLFLFVE